MTSWKSQRSCAARPIDGRVETHQQPRRAPPGLFGKAALIRAVLPQAIDV
jgi:hypothetical protein